MKSAVNTLYRLLWLREYDPGSYDEQLAFGRRYTLHWDDPEIKKPVGRRSGPSEYPSEDRFPMFKELAPYLRQRAVLLTVTHLEEDQIRVNVIPQKIKDGENGH
jgi:hypothetical protein